MHWLTSSALMAIFSVVLYLSARKSSLLKNSVQFNNLAMFLIPAIIYAVLANYRGVSMSVTPYQITIITLMAIFCSWLGNVASLKSIELAPNPGYSLVISKSYVIMTSLVAVFAFNAELTVKSMIAIVVIIFGSALVSVGKSKNIDKTNPVWILLSLLAFLCWGMLSLTSKYLLTIGVGIFPRLIYAMIIVSVLILGEIVHKKMYVKPSAEQLRILLLVGFSGAFFNYFMQEAFTTAPNIGFVNAINAGSISLVTLGSVLLFKDEFNVRRLAGVLIATAGLVTLVI